MPCACVCFVKEENENEKIFGAQDFPNHLNMFVFNKRKNNIIYGKTKLQ